MEYNVEALVVNYGGLPGKENLLPGAQLIMLEYDLARMDRALYQPVQTMITLDQDPVQGSRVHFSYSDPTNGTLILSDGPLDWFRESRRTPEIHTPNKLVLFAKGVSEVCFA